MKSRLIKIVSSLLLVACLATPAYAILPLVLTAAEMAAQAVTVAAITYLIPAFSTSNVPKTGYADNYGVKRNMLARVATGFGLAVTASIAYSELKSLVGAPGTPSGNAYPALSSSMYNPDSTELHVDMPVGQVFPFDGKYYKITGAQCYAFSGCSQYQKGYWNGTGVTTTNFGTLVIIEGPSANMGYCPGYAYSWGSARRSFYSIVETFPPNSLKPDAEIQAAINSPTLNELYPQILPDIDALFKNNPSSFQVPGDLSTQISDAQKQITSDAQTDLTDANDSRVLSLQEVVDSKQAAFDSNPTQENLDALNQAKADLAEAESEKAEDLLTEAQKEAEVFTAPATDTPAPHQFDFNPLVSIGSSFADKFPFSLVSTCSSIASGLVSSPTAPSFTINFPSPFNYAWVVSLSSFDNIAVMIRFLVGAAFLVAVSMTILRRWV